MHAIIVMPEDAPQNKIDKTLANGAEVVLYKRAYRRVAKKLHLRLQMRNIIHW